MFSAKYMAISLAIMFIALFGSTSAQWSPGGMMVYMGDLNLAAYSASGEKAAEPLAGSDKASVAMNSTLNNSSINVTSINSTTIDNSTLTSTSVTAQPQALVPSSGNPVLDLSGYAADRVNKNLAGYKNIMYPISGSRGTTASTAGGGGGCGCGA